jgi:hypothetical protein
MHGFMIESELSMELHLSVVLIYYHVGVLNWYALRSHAIISLMASLLCSVQQEANVALVLDPLVWHSDLGSNVTMVDVVWTLFWPYLVMAKCALLLYFFPLVVDF